MPKIIAEPVTVDPIAYAAAHVALAGLSCILSPLGADDMRGACHFTVIIIGSAVSTLLVSACTAVYPVWKYGTAANREARQMETEAVEMYKVYSAMGTWVSGSLSAVLLVTGFFCELPLSVWGILVLILANTILTLYVIQEEILRVTIQMEQFIGEYNGGDPSGKPLFIITMPVRRTNVLINGAFGLSIIAFLLSIGIFFTGIFSRVVLPKENVPAEDGDNDHHLMGDSLLDHNRPTEIRVRSIASFWYVLLFLNVVLQVSICGTWLRLLIKKRDLGEFCTVLPAPTRGLRWLLLGASFVSACIGSGLLTSETFFRLLLVPLSCFTFLVLCLFIAAIVLITLAKPQGGLSRGETDKEDAAVAATIKPDMFGPVQQDPRPLNREEYGATTSVYVDLGRQTEEDPPVADPPRVQVVPRAPSPRRPVPVFPPDVPEHNYHSPQATPSPIGGIHAPSPTIPLANVATELDQYI